MEGGGGVGPGLRKPVSSCLSRGRDRGSVSQFAETWTYQQEMIGLVNLGDRVVSHLEFKSGASYV